MVTKRYVNPDVDFSYSNPTFYRYLVRALQYLTITSLDLAFSVNNVFEHMHELRQSHFQGVEQILHYLSGTINFGLFYKSRPLQLTAYSDVD